MALKDKIERVHNDTDFKISFAGVTEEGEFVYDRTNGTVQPGLEYHIHYTKNKEEVYMLGGSHTPTSKIIRKIRGPKTLFSRYNELKTLSRKKYPSITPGYPTEADYRIGSFQRYFAKSLTISDAPVFEISHADYEIKNTSFDFIEIKWRITGEKDEVARVNGVTTINANEEMSGVARQLSVLEFWRPSSDSIDLIENKLSLLRNS